MQLMHQAAPGEFMISSLASAATECAATTSKQNRMASGSTWLSAPISNQTVVTLENDCRRASASMMSITPSQSAISCIGDLPNRHLIPDAGIEDGDQLLDGTPAAVVKRHGHAAQHACQGTARMKIPFGRRQALELADATVAIKFDM